MGPGLKPGPPGKRVSMEERGGSVIVGRRGAEALDADADDDSDVSSFLVIDLIFFVHSFNLLLLCSGLPASLSLLGLFRICLFADPKDYEYE